MLRSLICYIILFISLTSTAQTNKKQWMIGGEGSFMSISNGRSPFSNNYTVFTISPVIGYFIMNGLAGGMRFDFSKNLSGYSYWLSHTNAIAPFLRYYFGKSQKVNFLIDGAYVRKWVYISGSGYKENYNGYSFKVGPAIFLNPHIALEVTLGYYHEKETDFDFMNNEFQSEVGFKYHFGRKK